jgi:hypothetical protein
LAGGGLGAGLAGGGLGGGAARRRGVVVMKIR